MAAVSGPGIPRIIKRVCGVSCCDRNMLSKICSASNTFLLRRCCATQSRKGGPAHRGDGISDKDDDSGSTELYTTTAFSCASVGYIVVRPESVFSETQAIASTLCKHARRTARLKN